MKPSLNPARTRPESTLLLLKRLEADRFVWPNGGDTITLSAEQLHWLLDGIDLAVIQKHPQRYYARMN
ncbi:IS66 family insertion sequence element accessory protein TnpB [Burkholderia gladioli]|uniref:IS66 family insertion sequence element accessory protein TnpB n=1 Tax=Burkholderia gladioli TaxID=28095 RepID=UPI003B50FD7C